MSKMIYYSASFLSLRFAYPSALAYTGQYYSLRGAWKGFYGRLVEASRKSHTTNELLRQRVCPAETESEVCCCGSKGNVQRTRDAFSSARATSQVPKSQLIVMERMTENRKDVQVLEVQRCLLERTQSRNRDRLQKGGTSSKEG